MQKVRTQLVTTQVCGLILKDLSLQDLMPCKVHGGIVRNVQPLVRIDSYAIRIVDALREVRVSRRTTRTATKSSINVHPEVVSFLKPAYGFEVVEINCVDGSGAC